jgi:hypothetical protein
MEGRSWPHRFTLSASTVERAIPSDSRTASLCPQVLFFNSGMQMSSQTDDARRGGVSVVHHRDEYFT